MIFSSIDEVLELYSTWGPQNYSEDISQTEHAVQCARLAMANQASSDLVVASLLHDVGHLIELYLRDGKEDHSFDAQHESIGSRSLARIFPPSVRLPIALHVEAKRWLCAQESAYVSTLSNASLHSLELQGGPMSDGEIVRFESMTGSSDAIALRRWDDAAKDELLGGDFNDFSHILHQHAGSLYDKP